MRPKRDAGVTTVLDASALLAHLLDEPGAGEVNESLDEGAVISAVNWAEVLSRLSDLGSDPRRVAADLEAQGLLATLTIVPFDPEDAITVGALRNATRGPGLSLGDRACLSLALRLGAPALTADRAWDEVDSEVEVRQIR
ncbi:MAG: type II toxin-antitoxin system VapC family toxin [Actinomycetota bacterium]|nr:type II toxin-antitoxin system VapC family toxin [Actinomycetota bacterium]